MNSNGAYKTYYMLNPSDQSEVLYVEQLTENPERPVIRTHFGIIKNDGVHVGQPSDLKEIEIDGVTYPVISDYKEPLPPISFVALAQQISSLEANLVKKGLIEITPSLEEHEHNLYMKNMVTVDTLQTLADADMLEPEDISAWVEERIEKHGV
jgi:hypothetical protein